MKERIIQLIDDRKKAWGIALAVGLLFALLGKACTAPEVVIETININAPQAMQKSFEQTLADTELNKKYEIKFTSKDANFTVTTKKSDSNEFIAYSPVIAVFNVDEELYQTYIEKEIFVPSDTEPEAYDFDFQKIMKDIIENPNSTYKVYYPDESICNWNVFYTFLLYTVNDGCYPSDGTNMAEIKELVNAFLQSKNTETISRESLNKIRGFSTNSIYFMPLADLGYIYETVKLQCRVIYPKTVVYCNYYADFDEVGKVLFDVLDQETGDGFWDTYKDFAGYYNLWVYGNYSVEQYKETVSIVYDKTEGDKTIRYSLILREHFNAVDIPDTK